MNAYDLLNGLAEVLPAPLVPMQVTLSIHEDEADAHELLGVGPENGRLCLWVEDEVMSAGEDDQDAGLARVTLRALLQTAKDFSLPRGAGLISGGTGGNVPLLVLCGWVRCLIQRVLFERDDFDNSFGLRYLGSRLYTGPKLDGVRCREMRFQCVMGLDVPVSGNPLIVS